jgi:Reverse transcriptase (RNA-dependent DNA polymerase)
METLIIDGTETSDKNLIKNHVQDFYQQLYSHGRETSIDNTFFDQMFSVDNDQNELINADITLNELWLTLKGLKATTPGPDGISNAYLKKLFDIIGPLILDAWSYSIMNNELMTSHQRSYLRLIPKPGKDKRELKNWRPITLSNCDHKLITKTYNNRLLKIITDYITPTQTAYIKGRNIADNLRLLNALTKNCNFNMNINSSIVALDAQKAFDSVNHSYIATVLEKTGLTNFVPIFKLLYKNLTNDILINGQAGVSFQIKNGVKQGDALSCSLFILAIEPVLRNLQVNDNIQAITCNRLNFTWPKVLAYADDISVITQNNHRSIQAIFTEYDRLSKASGLFLNADKTELFNITSPNTFAMQMHSVIYDNQTYNIQNATSVKINGIIFNTDKDAMANENYDVMAQKMHKHFLEWSKRSLSILGKIQIIKTFGLSQYLYSLAVIELTQAQWKEINTQVAKFIWNKNYVGNRAPNRFSNLILFKPVVHGGFGMLQLDKVTCGLRMRRFSYLLEKNSHPINQLQIKLGSNEFLRAAPIVDIDATTATSLAKLTEHNLKCIQNYDLDELETDRLFRLKLCNTKLSNIVQKQKRNNPLLARLRNQDIHTIHDALLLGDQAIESLRRICKPELNELLQKLSDLPHIDHRAHTPLNLHLYDLLFRKWVNIASLSSSKIRTLLDPGSVMLRTKLLEFDNVEMAHRTFLKIKKIKSAPLKTKVLRLIHGDVYCGTRLVQFKLSEIDTCVRCFAPESIEHLVSHCPYNKQIWRELGIINPTIKEILNPEISDAAFEIRCSLLETTVFRKQQTPPDIVIYNTFNKYAQGTCKNKKLIEYAQGKMASKIATGTWL